MRRVWRGGRFLIETREGMFSFNPLALMGRPSLLNPRLPHFHLTKGD